LVLEDQSRRHEAAPRLEQAAKQRSGHVEGRVGDHVIRPAREAEIGGVGLYHDDATSEPLAQATRSPGVRFDRDDPRAHLEERASDHAGAGADVEDGGTGDEPRLSDEPSRPGGVELVPAPTPPGRVHGDAP
jgi:hypothetical protein